mmetsp:Transcript_3993/g.4627  ORF Transcript_3993/g.4627 Transcript_3993/m.4627 type:complete len:275 (+) Transcript_3993:167-991(+)
MTLGLACLISAVGNNDYLLRYDDKCQSSASSNTSCTFTITLDTDLDSPNIYYQIEGFYANHRKYVKSRSYKQLRGDGVGRGDVSEYCSPIMENKDIPVTQSYTGSALNSTDLAYPCGLIGKYRFTDVFTITGSSAPIVIKMDDIAHSNDKKMKFKNSGNSKDTQWLDFEEQRLMVWYQMESFPDFIKLYGKVSGKMEKGNYTVMVDNQWDTKQIKAQKSIYFSTTNGLGGTNLFLGICFLIVAFIVMIIMLMIMIFECTRASKANHYSLDNLKW